MSTCYIGKFIMNLEPPLPETSSFLVKVTAFLHYQIPYQPLGRSLRAQRHHWEQFQGGFQLKAFKS